MKKAIVIGGSVVIVLVLLIAGGVYFLVGSLDDLVKTAIEDVGTEATGAEVKVTSVKISLGSGAGALNGLRIGNPSGFETPQALRLGAISVALDTATVTQDPVVIKEIVITKPDVTYEIVGGTSNIDALRRNVDAFVEKTNKDLGRGGGGDDTGEAPKLIIEHLYVRDGTVEVSAGALKGKTLNAPLPDLHLTDIGKEEGGATPAEIADAVMTALGRGANKAVATLDLDAVLGAASETGKKVLETGKGGLEGAGSAVQKGAESVGGALKNVLGGD